MDTEVAEVAELQARAEASIVRVAANAQVVTPRVEIDDKHGMAAASKRKNLVVVSTGALRSLPDRQLDTLLGHEVGHIHLRKRKSLLLNAAGAVFYATLIVPGQLVALTAAEFIGTTLGGLSVAACLAAAGLRHLEFRADDFSAKATKDPLALCDALDSDCGDAAWESKPVKSKMLRRIDHYLYSKLFAPGRILSVHPTDEKRKARLRRLAVSCYSETPPLERASSCDSTTAKAPINAIDSASMP
jgi:Zn-dependent protease with chaperone function